jgi:hypothetical protein
VGLSGFVDLVLMLFLGCSSSPPYVVPISSGALGRSGRGHRSGGVRGSVAILAGGKGARGRAWMTRTPARGVLVHGFSVVTLGEYGMVASEVEVYVFGAQR